MCRSQPPWSYSKWTEKSLPDLTSVNFYRYADISPIHSGHWVSQHKHKYIYCEYAYRQINISATNLKDAIAKPKGEKNQKGNLCCAQSGVLLLQQLVSYCTSVCQLPWQSSKITLICSSPQINFFVTPLWLFVCTHPPPSFLPDTDYRQALLAALLSSVTSLFPKAVDDLSLSHQPGQKAAEHCNFMHPQQIWSMCVHVWSTCT